MAIDFSVVIPVYNGARYLAETLHSVLDQTLAPAEIIVIDDGSTDDSLAIAQSFGDRITTIRRENSGVSATRNHGVSVAKSSWIAFMDADDLWEPTYLERQTEAIRHTPHADLCYTGRRDLVMQKTGDFVLGGPVRVPSLAEFPRYVIERSPFGPTCFVIRRATFNALGGFDSRFDAIEDWDLNLRLLAAGAIFAHVPESLVRYRVHPASITHNPLPVLAKYECLVRERIMPRLSAAGRMTKGRRVLSRLTGEAAILLRESRSEDAMRWMLRSIAMYPFHAPRRYKVFAHMVLRRREEDRQHTPPGER